MDAVSSFCEGGLPHYGRIYMRINHSAYQTQSTLLHCDQ